jgi:hypothetical protein
MKNGGLTMVYHEKWVILPWTEIVIVDSFTMKHLKNWDKWLAKKVQIWDWIIQESLELSRICCGEPQTNFENMLQGEFGTKRNWGTWAAKIHIIIEREEYLI